MKVIINIFFILLVVSISSCKKESQRQTATPFSGKVKTITDNTYGYDSLYLFYDSISGNLKNIIIHRTNFISGDSVNYRITIGHDNNIINFKIFTNNDTSGVLFKITTIGKQITAISQINSDNTETMTKQIYINSNRVDSVFDIGLGTGGYWSDISSMDFMYSNGNCVYYTSDWTQLYDPLGPVYGKAYDTLHFYYNIKENTQTLFYQQPLEINLHINTSFMLDLLQLDGYYILPQNNNLIDSFVAISSGITKYSYEFNVDNKVSVVRINNGTEQHMTYY